MFNKFFISFPITYIIKSWFKNFLRAFSVAANLLTYTYTIQNKDNDDVYNTFHADGRCSLEEIVYFDRSYKTKGIDANGSRFWEYKVG